MSKTIRVSTEMYDHLKAMREEKESFEDVIGMLLTIAGRKSSEQVESISKENKLV